MNKPTLQSEGVTVTESSHPAQGAVIEIRKLTLQTALRIVREQIDRDDSHEHE